MWHSRIEDSKAMKTPTSWRDFKFFKLEYEQLNEHCRSRDNTTIVGGSILVAASILLLGSCIQLVGENKIEFRLKILTVFASLAIYVIWLLCFNLTSIKVSDLYYARLREMERHAPAPDTFVLRNSEQFDMELHRYFREQVKGEWWFYLRRTIWVLFLWVLAIVGMVIILH